MAPIKPEKATVTLSADLLDRALRSACYCFVSGSPLSDGHDASCLRGQLWHLIAEARGTLCAEHNRPPGCCPSWQHKEPA